MLGSRVGAKFGALFGSRVGSSSDDEGASFTIDSAAGRAAPANAAEWTAFMTAAGLATGNPSSVWNCQDASGNLLDSIGSVPLTPTGAVTYQNAVAGWARSAVNIPQTSGARCVAAAGVGPNPTTTSVLLLGYMDVTAQAAANRGLMSVAGALADTLTSAEAWLIATTHVAQAECVSVVTAGTADPFTGGVRPFVLKYNRTGSAFVYYDDLQKITGTFAAGVTDGNKGFGATANAQISLGLSLLYGALFSGAPAELSDAQVKTVLTTAGWTIPWS